MNNKRVGANTAERSKQSSIRDRSSGFARVSGQEKITVPDYAIIVADEISPLPERPLDQILEEIKGRISSASGLSMGNDTRGRSDDCQ